MMKQENLFKKLGSILYELNDQYQFLSQNPEQLNELELELFLANANFLADHIQIIKKLSTTSSTLALPPAETKAPVEVKPAQVAVINEVAVESPEVVANEENIFSNDNISPKIIIDDVVDEEVAEAEPQEKEPIEEDVVAEDKVTSEPTASSLDKDIFKLDKEASSFEFILGESTEDQNFDFEEKSVDEMFDRPLSEAEQHIIDQKRKIQDKPPVEVTELEEDELGPEPFLVHTEVEEEKFAIVKEDLELKEAPEPVVPKTVVATEDPAAKRTLNDILASRTNTQSVNIQTTGATVKDLKQAISLNDKLLYIKDLFNGYNLAYAEAIDLANRLPNFEAADNFFQKNYALKNSWADKQATVDKFYKLLNERFK